ncbi:MAG: arginine N-succinyltransferase [Mariniblastus sp.]|nr:arginine N-succinyltransferase [Mariniblastus sp.]
MLIVRRVQESDLDPLFELIQKSEYGLTTLKVSKEELESRIERSLFAFSQKSAKPNGQPYVFVMEDLNNGKIVGTCSIYSKIGGFEPMYSYEIKESVHQSSDLDPPVEHKIKVLHLREEHDGPTEIGSLFLSPEYWGGGHGRLLSLARFLFMAEFSSRFEEEVVAEMRGVVDKSGKSPLWAALGSHFFQIEFPKAETLTSQSKKFIADLMPKHPIYIPLLPEGAREVIGQVHENTRPALSVLEKEGFEFKNLVDIFDGGPTMHCKMSKIRAIQRSCSGHVAGIEKEVVDGRLQIVSNARLDFRVCLGKTAWDQEQVTIDQVTALRLALKVGDKVRCMDLRPSP